MGFSPLGRLLRIELPLALPVIIPGVRSATVTIIGLAAVAGLLATPSLGNLIYICQNRPIRTAVTVGIGLSDRQSDVWGTGVDVRIAFGGSGFIQTNKQK